MTFWEQVWPEISNQSIQDLEIKSTRIEISRGSYLYEAGQNPEGIFAIETGLIGLTAICANGNEVLLRLFGPNQYFGHRSIMAEEPYHATATAMEICKVRKLRKDHLFTLMQNDFALCRSILKTLARELKHQEDRLCTLAEKPVASRIAEGLIYLTSIDEDHKFTRMQIAEYCGTTEPTVIRTLARFEKEALISQIGRKIKIINREALLNVALSERD